MDVDEETRRAIMDSPVVIFGAKLDEVLNEQVFQDLLENALRDAQKATRDAQAEAASHAGDAQELAELRNALWSYAQGTDDPEGAVRQREIPKGVIIIGGHPTWARAMEKETGARAWATGATCPMQVIAEAAEIWIQPAYIAHKEFYRVIDAARRQEKIVRYFPSTGVARCVEAMRQEQ